MRVFRLALLFAISAAISPSGAGQAEAPPWGRYFERLRPDQLMEKLSREAKPEDVAFVGATVIPMSEGTELLADQTVIVSGGRIAAIGRRAKTPVPAGMRRVDARGKFLFPGLTDVHVHTLQHTPTISSIFCTASRRSARWTVIRGCCNSERPFARTGSSRRRPMSPERSSTARRWGGTRS
jgi:hypothetical protein